MKEENNFAPKSLKTGDNVQKNRPRHNNQRRGKNTSNSNNQPNKQSGKPGQRKIERGPRRPGLTPVVQKKDTIPPIERDDIRVITLGGVEEVGRNMFAIETHTDLYLFDVGFEFTDGADTPGVDYSLPNISYLEERKDKITAAIITHAHLDHIGGIPFLMDRLGNPPIYTKNLTSLMIKKREEEFPHNKPLSINIVDDHTTHKIGDSEFYFFPVTHSIPECVGISMRTKYGNIIVTGDIKLEHTDGVPNPEEVDQWAQVAKEDNLLLLSDSTNCENPGWSLPEPVIHKTVNDIIVAAPSRVIIACFASHFRRMIEFVKSAENLGKKVVLEGRSMKVNMEIARITGFFTPKDGTIIDSSHMSDYAPDKIVVLCTGGQGEPFAALPRMARDEHKDIRLNERDTIVFSSSVIPGNEIQVRTLMDQLWRKDTKIVHYKTSDVHSTGHGNQEELKWIINKVAPKNFCPAYGYHSMLKQHRLLALQCGLTDEQIHVPDDGSIIEIKGKDDVRLLKVKAPGDPIMVDGFHIGQINQTIITDRQLLSNDGFFNVIVSINVQKGKLIKSPDIISRGFVYLRDSQALLSQARGLVKRLAEQEIRSAKGGKVEVDRLKKDIQKQVERLLLQKTNKRPLVIPVVLVV